MTNIRNSCSGRTSVNIDLFDMRIDPETDTFGPKSIGSSGSSRISSKFALEYFNPWSHWKPAELFMHQVFFELFRKSSLRLRSDSPRGHQKINYLTLNPSLYLHFFSPSEPRLIPFRFYFLLIFLFERQKTASEAAVHERSPKKNDFKSLFVFFCFLI